MIRLGVLTCCGPVVMEIELNLLNSFSRLGDAPTLSSWMVIDRGMVKVLVRGGKATIGISTITTSIRHGGE